ncbi:MAG TPA: hypothetical protein VF593_08835 [Chthoniobacteraceae bacterium]|jgi:hypothetical protein
MSLLLAAAARFAERIKVNSISRQVRDGRIFWIKRRRWFARPMMACANRFFRLAGSPMRALDDSAAWQRWEINCLHHLHGGEFQAFTEGPRAIATEEVPGVGLAFYLDAGTLTPAMAAAAGRELRRAHAFTVPPLRGLWSHGDSHAGNFVYEPKTDRARLIDFEVTHDPATGAEERHADDLLVFLQDVIGRIARAAWLPTARAFLEGYERPEILALLEQRLVVPRGIPQLWWAIRTASWPSAEIEQRLEELRAILPPAAAMEARRQA